MDISATRKSAMTLYSGRMCLDSHVCRIVLLEKGVDCHIQYLNTDSDFEELAELNPYNEPPALIDRDLVLYSADVIAEYLDERLPYPPLLPVDPVGRAQARLLIMRLRRDWIEPAKLVQNGGELGAAEIQALRDGLISASAAFRERPFMMGPGYSLVDCYMAPLLWRLSNIGIKLPRQADPLVQFAERLFRRPSFALSLSDMERELRR